MSSTSDKLGIPNIIVLERTGSLVVVQECDIDNLKKQRDELLEAFVKIALFYETHYKECSRWAQYKIAITAIEAIAEKPWEQVKELIK
jgi:hypothetical protein